MLTTHVRRHPPVGMPAVQPSDLKWEQVFRFQAIIDARQSAQAPTTVLPHLEGKALTSLATGHRSLQEGRFLQSDNRYIRCVTIPPISRQQCYHVLQGSSATTHRHAPLAFTSSGLVPSPPFLCLSVCLVATTPNIPQSAFLCASLVFGNLSSCRIKRCPASPPTCAHQCQHSLPAVRGPAPRQPDGTPYTTLCPANLI